MTTTSPAAMPSRFELVEEPLGLADAQRFSEQREYESAPDGVREESVGRRHGAAELVDEAVEIVGLVNAAEDLAHVPVLREEAVERVDPAGQELGHGHEAQRVPGWRRVDHDPVLRARLDAFGDLEERD